MSEQIYINTQVWEYHRVYSYKSRTTPKNNREFEVTIELEFPEDWSEYDIDQRTDEVARISAYIMDRLFFQTANERGYGSSIGKRYGRKRIKEPKPTRGYDPDTWRDIFVDGSGETLDTYVAGAGKVITSRDEYGVGAWRTERGYERTKKSPRRHEMDKVICEDLEGPRRIERFEYPVEAWNLLNHAYFSPPRSYEELYREIERKYGASRADSLKMQYLIANRPRNKCRFIRKAGLWLRGEWVVVDEKNYYRFGGPRGNTVRGSVEYNAQKLWGQT